MIIQGKIDAFFRNVKYIASNLNMPCILLNVHNWNPDQQGILQINNGGHNPHITLFQTPSPWDSEKLIDIGSKVLKTLFLEHPNTTFLLTPENASISSFLHERSGKNRYDVLLNLRPDDQELIQKLRKIVLDFAGPNEKLNMLPPHVTHSIHWSEEEALATLQDLKLKLPIQISIHGFTI